MDTLLKICSFVYGLHERSKGQVALLLAFDPPLDKQVDFIRPSSGPLELLVRDSSKPGRSFKAAITPSYHLTECCDSHLALVNSQRQSGSWEMPSGMSPGILDVGFSHRKLETRAVASARVWQDIVV
jgi:hypothetical protein